VSGPDEADPGNPFSARRLCPGASPYLFPPGQDIATLLARLRQNDWWGQIIGVHGSGKSSLLAMLIPAISKEGRQVRLVELHDGQRKLPPEIYRRGVVLPESVLVVDGYEQLSRWSRLRTRQYCRRLPCGLIVTAHAPVGLPDLFRTSPTLEAVRELVVQLLEGRPMPWSVQELSDRFERHRGNVRELLFELYDLYEAHLCRPRRRDS
jgi:hypothetical protein